MTLRPELSHTASIASLPVETLSQIFTNSSGEDYKITLSAQQDSTAYPQNLRLVCKHWDEIIVSSPQFWTNFLLDVCSLPEIKRKVDMTVFQKSAFTTSLLRFCLLRSKHHLLRFSIKASRYHLAYLPTLLSMLLPYASRWEVLDLDFPVDAFDLGHRDFMLCTDFLLFGISFPQLRELKLKIEASSVCWIRDQYSLLVRLLKNTPLLSKLEYSDCPRWMSTYCPISHITHFTTTTISSYTECLNLLPLMPALVHLTIFIKRCRHSMFLSLPGPEPIPLQSLNLHIQIPPTESNDVSTFFDRLPPSPALTHFKMSSLTSCSLSMKSFLRRSKCIIKSLDLERASSEPLLKLIRILPRLESLDVGLVHFSKALIDGLTFPSELDTAECNGRWIKKMVIRNPVVRGPELDSFVKMFESRLGLADHGGELRCGLGYLYVVVRAGKGARKRSDRLVELLTELRSSYKGNVFLSDNRSV